MKTIILNQEVLVCCEDVVNDIVQLPQHSSYKNLENPFLNYDKMNNSKTDLLFY